jgi:hypothetical protein
VALESATAVAVASHNHDYYYVEYLQCLFRFVHDGSTTISIGRRGRSASHAHVLTGTHTTIVVIVVIERQSNG